MDTGEKAIEMTVRESEPARARSPKKIVKKKTPKKIGQGSSSPKKSPKRIGETGPSMSFSDVATVVHESSPKASAARAMLQRSPPGPVNDSDDNIKSLFLPVAPVLSTLEKERRNAFYRELLVYLVFVLLFIVHLLWKREIHAMWAQDFAIEDLFIDEEFPGIDIKKSFHDIMTFDELWQFLEGPLISGLYWTDWYNGDPFTSTTAGLALNGRVLYNQKLVGGARLRQIRVEGISCEVASFDNKLCYPEFFPKYQETATLNHTGSGTFGDVIHTFSGGLTNLKRGVFSPSWADDYGTGGYLVSLGTTSAEATTMLSKLKSTLFLDQTTRALSIDFALWAPSTNLLSAVQLLFEMSPSGNIAKTVRIWAIQPFPYDTPFGTLRIVLDCALIGFVLYYLSVELREFAFQGPRQYFTSFFNVLELTRLSMLFAYGILWALYFSDDVRQDFNPAFDSSIASNYQDYSGLAYKWIDLMAFGSFIVLINFVLVFKYLKFNFRMMLLWRTLSAALGDLIAFMTLFTIISFGFAFVAHLSFGYRLFDYHSPLQSFSSTLRMLIGDMDYERLRVINSIVAPIFLVLYMFLVFFIVLNVAIAIINEYYNEVTRQRNKDAKKEIDGGVEYDLWRILKGWLDNRYMKRLKVMPLSNPLMPLEFDLSDRCSIDYNGSAPGNLLRFALNFPRFGRYMEIGDRLQMNFEDPSKKRANSKVKGLFSTRKFKKGACFEVTKVLPEHRGIQVKCVSRGLVLTGASVSITKKASIASAVSDQVSSMMDLRRSSQTSSTSSRSSKSSRLSRVSFIADMASDNLKSIGKFVVRAADSQVQGRDLIAILSILRNDLDLEFQNGVEYLDFDQLCALSRGAVLVAYTRKKKQIHRRIWAIVGNALGFKQKPDFLDSGSSTPQMGASIPEEEAPQPMLRTNISRQDTGLDVDTPTSTPAMTPRTVDAVTEQAEQFSLSLMRLYGVERNLLPEGNLSSLMLAKSKLWSRSARGISSQRSGLIGSAVSGKSLGGIGPQTGGGGVDLELFDSIVQEQQRNHDELKSAFQEQLKAVHDAHRQTLIELTSVRELLVSQLASQSKVENRPTVDVEEVEVDNQSPPNSPASVGE